MIKMRWRVVPMASKPWLKYSLFNKFENNNSWNTVLRQFVNDIITRVDAYDDKNDWRFHDPNTVISYWLRIISYETPNLSQINSSL